jgi:hypothetical protein
MATDYELEVEMAGSKLIMNLWQHYRVFIACSPWGKPFAICATREEAEKVCSIVELSPEMVLWRDDNREMGIDWYKEFTVVELPLPTLLMLIKENGELVTNHQDGMLLRQEHGDPPNNK